MSELLPIQTSFKNAAEIITRLKPSQSFYCLAPQVLQNNVETFINHFPGSVAWAVKSNPDPLVVRTISANGINDFDVASLPEVELIRSLCPNARLHFNHPVKAPEAIKTAYEQHGVVNFMVDHTDEIHKIAAMIGNPEKVTLLIRFFDPSIIPSSEYNFGKKFGAIPSEAVKLLVLATNLNFNVGLAFHPGTQYQKTGIYRHLLETAETITQEASKQANIKICRVNVGGGFPAYYPGETLPLMQDYFSTVRSAISDVKNRTFGPDCEFICEPGRALVADIASLVARVELKRDDGRIYINDGFYGGLMEQQFVDFTPPVRAYSADGIQIEADARDYEKYTVFGPTCDSLDTLRQKVSLPRSLKIGDYLEFGFMGAYSNASATRFNGFKPAPIMTVDHLDGWSHCSRPASVPLNGATLLRPDTTI
jgi:ornithine decarboxylase